MNIRTAVDLEVAKIDDKTGARKTQGDLKVARNWLSRSAIFWFIVACIGQWIFVFYIAGHYGGSAIQGNTENYNTMTIIGHADGDVIGNIMFAVHVLLAATITLGGTLQLMPQIRNRAMTFHRWNGRAFILSALIMAIGGTYLVWIRGAQTTTLSALAITPNSIFIIWFAMMTYVRARGRQIMSHRKWALRTFIVVNGVWFFRVGLMGWTIIAGPELVGENLDGPFAVFWSFANYLLPLAILEMFFLAQGRGGVGGKLAMAIILFLLTLVMAVGILGATLFMWAPAFSL